jgi:hypothetical protein
MTYPERGSRADSLIQRVSQKPSIPRVRLSLTCSPLCGLIILQAAHWIARVQNSVVQIIRPIGTWNQKA